MRPCYSKALICIIRTRSDPPYFRRLQQAVPGAALIMRAGRYVKQPADYLAFIPSPLPPDPTIQMDAELTRLLSDADRALGRLDGVASVLPNPNLFVGMYVRREAV